MTEITELEHRLADALGRMRMAFQSTRRALVSAQDRIATLEDHLEAAQAAVSAQPAAPAGAGDPAELDALRAEIQALTEARQAAAAETAQLQDALKDEREQVAALVRQADADKAALQGAQGEVTALKSSGRLGAVQATGQAEELQTRLGALETVVAQLQMANAQLRQNNQLLRDAQVNGAADPALLNDSLTAEVESLKAARAADRAEIDSVLAALQPLIEETADA